MKTLSAVCYVLMVFFAILAAWNFCDGETGRGIACVACFVLWMVAASICWDKSP